MQSSRDSRQARQTPEIDSPQSGAWVAGWQSSFQSSSFSLMAFVAIGGLFAVVAVFASYTQGLPTHERAGQPRVPVGIDRLRPHRHR